MTLEQVPNVKLHFNTDRYNFIVVELTESNGNTKTVIRVGHISCSHEHLFTLLCEELRKTDIRTKPLGGGEFGVSSAERGVIIKKEIWQCRREPDRKKTIELLEAAYQGYVIVNF